MTERPSYQEGEINPEWKEQIEAAISGAIEFFPTPQEHELPGTRIIDMNPASLTEGEDDRLFEQLSPREKAFIRKILFRQLAPEVIKSKNVLVGTDRGRERVFRTSQDRTFLHEVTKKMGSAFIVVDYFLTGEDFIL
jgi:hypothetical protein